MMNDSALHLTEDELHDAADGTAVPVESSRAGRHLATCARCRADIDRIRELLALTAGLPRSIDPPAEVWSGIQSRIAQSAGPVVSRDVAPAARAYSFGRDGRWLAAAAIVLIAASSGLTMLLMRPEATEVARVETVVAPAERVAEGTPEPVAERIPERVPERATERVPERQSQRAPEPTVRTVADEYDRLDRELATLLAAQRGKLLPETILKVERNLAIIDEAIAEIRQALVEDPGNEALRALLRASYGQKSALVRQVSAS